MTSILKLRGAPALSSSRQERLSRAVGEVLPRLAALAADIAKLHGEGRELLIVSSGSTKSSDRGEMLNATSVLPDVSVT